MKNINEVPTAMTCLKKAMKNINDIPTAMTCLKKAMKNDKMYAWGWHCNIAMSSYDEGMEHKAANRAAANFMKLAFDIDTTTMDEYKEIQNYEETT